MPKVYEAMRDKFLREGMSEKAAKAKAVRIYNAKHPSNPVGKHHKLEKAVRRALKQRRKS